MSFNIVVFDLDGTLTSSKGRWDGDSLTPENPESHPVWTVVSKALAAHGKDIWVATARPERFRPQTISWLSQNKLPCSRLLMRADDDMRPDAEVKKDLLLPYLGRILCIFDDKPSVPETFRYIGVPCALVSAPPEGKEEASFWKLRSGAGFTIYGASIRPSGHDPEEHRQALEDEKDGYIFGAWCSEVTAEQSSTGHELGSNHTSRCTRITAQEYARALHLLGIKPHPRSAMHKEVS